MPAPFLEKGTYFALDWKNNIYEDMNLNTKNVGKRPSVGESPVYFVVKNKEQHPLFLNPGSTSGYYGYIGSVSAGSTSGWNEIQDANSDNVLEPDNQFEIWHIAWGIKPSIVEVYVKYPTNELLGSLGNQSTSTDGSWGGIPGDESPYEFPNYEKTQFFTTRDNHPSFNIYNPSVNAQTVKMRFRIEKYKVGVVKPTPQVRARAIKMPLGGLTGLPAPSWLLTALSRTDSGYVIQ